MARWDPKQAFKFAQMKRQLALIVIALDQMSNAQQPLRGCAVANAGPSASPYARAIELRRSECIRLVTRKRQERVGEFPPAISQESGVAPPRNHATACLLTPRYVALRGAMALRAAVQALAGGEIPFRP